MYTVVALNVITDFKARVFQFQNYLMLGSFYMNMPIFFTKYEFALAFLLHPFVHVFWWLLSLHTIGSVTAAVCWLIMTHDSFTFMLSILTFIDRHVKTLPIQWVEQVFFVIRLQRSPQGNIEMFFMQGVSLADVILHFQQLIYPRLGMTIPVSQVLVQFQPVNLFEQKCHELIISDMHKHRVGQFYRINEFTQQDLQHYFKTRWNYDVQIAPNSIYFINGTSLTIQDIYGILTTEPSHDAEPWVQFMYKVFKDQQHCSSANSIPCIMCCDAPRTVLYLPCKHLVACRACSTKSLETPNPCAVCKEPIAQLLSIHVP
jgi:hypothetical protein